MFAVPDGGASETKDLNPLSTNHEKLSSRLVARSGLGLRDFHTVDGFVFRRAHRFVLRPHLQVVDALADAPPARSVESRDPEVRAFHGILHLLSAAFPRIPARAARMAMDVGACGAVHRGGLRIAR